MRHLYLFLLVFTVLTIPVAAQDALNLPTELYVLLNDGKVQRFGLNAAGVQTVTPAGEFVVDFGIAPDGNWIAYRTPSGLYIADMFDLEHATRIEGERASVPPIRGKGDTIAWTPNANAIAYTTEYGLRVHFRNGDFADVNVGQLAHLLWSPDGRFLAAETGDNNWWIYRRGESTMELTSAIPSALGAAWVDVAQLIFTPPDGGLFRMDLNSNNEQVELLDDFRQYRLPLLRTDGTVHLFGTVATGEDEPEGEFGRLLELTLDDSGSIIVNEIGEADIELTDLQWRPDGEYVVLFRGGVLAIADPLTGNGITLPITSIAAYDWGVMYPTQVDAVTLPNVVYFLAPDELGIRQVWRLPTDETPAVVQTEAETDVTEYAVSADGRSITYISDGQLWLWRRDSGADPVPLVETANRMDVNPVFSAAADRIAYRVSGDEAGITLFTLEGDAPEFLIADRDLGGTVQNPRFASGVSALLVDVITGEGKQIVLIDPFTEERRIIGSYDHAQWLSGTQLLVIGQSPLPEQADPAVQILDINAAEAEPTVVLTLPNGVRMRSAAQVDADTLHLLVQAIVPGELRVLQIGMNGADVTVLANLGFMRQPQLSPDGSVVIGYTAPDEQMVIQNVFTNTPFVLNPPTQISQLTWQ